MPATYSIDTRTGVWSKRTYDASSRRRSRQVGGRRLAAHLLHAERPHKPCGHRKSLGEKLGRHIVMHSKVAHHLPGLPICRVLKGIEVAGAAAPAAAPVEPKGIFDWIDAGVDVSRASVCA